MTVKVEIFILLAFFVIDFQILGVRLVNWLKYPIDCNSFIYIAISESAQQDENKNLPEQDIF